MEKIKNFFNKIFWRKRRTNRNPNKVLLNFPEKNNFRKRNFLNIKFRINWKLKVLKRNYIPYYLIFWFLSIIITFLIFLWPIFRVEKINIYRKDGITNINIAYNALNDFRWYSIFKIEKEDLLKKLKDYQENVKDIDFKINFPKTIDIHIESFKEKFNVNINNKNYILIENWVLIPVSEKNNDLKNLEIIKNIDKTTILDYKTIFEKEYISKIEEIEKKVLENIAWINITWLKYYEKERELHIILNNYTRLLFSLDKNINIEEQIKSLAVLDREKSQVSKNDKFYIDLRVKWKVFLCFSKINWKNNEKQCKTNLEYIYWKL